MSNVKEPKHFRLFRIIGLSVLAVGVLLIVLGVAVFREDWGDGETVMNFALFVPGIMLSVLSVPLVMIGFTPKITKMQVETAKYLQQSNKGDLKDIATTSADIASDSIATVVKTVKNATEDTKFCKYCGEQIDLDSVFCKSCGKQQ